MSLALSQPMGGGDGPVQGKEGNEGKEAKKLGFPTIVFVLFFVHCPCCSLPHFHSFALSHSRDPLHRHHTHPHHPLTHCKSCSRLSPDQQRLSSTDQPSSGTSLLLLANRETGNAAGNQRSQSLEPYSQCKKPRTAWTRILRRKKSWSLPGLWIH